MSAARLREAADVLRAKALAAQPGPWRSWVEGRDGWGADNGILTAGDDIYPFTDVGTQDFMAAVNPVVALAVADWIASVADMAEKRGVKVFARGYKSALDVADAILGGAK